MKYTVELDPSFQDGELNTEHFKDFDNLSDSELQHIATFSDKVISGIPLVGKNKPSWLDDDQNVIPNTISYEEGGYWHYHCGDYPKYAKVKSLTYNLSLNINGLTSSQVIHYIKENNNNIVIVGYSPKHTPFPASDDPYYSNPLFGEEE